MNERIKRILIEDCEKSEAEIASMSKDEVLEAILTYEGFIGYTSWIIRLIEDVYGVKLGYD